MVTVKISAHPNDQAFKRALEEQLEALQTEGKIKLIGEVGENPFEAYEDAKLPIELLVVLLSPDYLSDPTLETNDIAPVMALKVQHSKLYWVQPVLLRACDYSSRPYAEFPAFPIPSGEIAPSPIVAGSWPTELDALLSVVSSIKLGVAYIHSNKKQPETPIETVKGTATPIKKILVLTSNPKDTQSLDLNVEINNIKEVLKRSKYRDEYEIELCLDVNKDDLLETLLQEKPMVVHFSGHGIGANGLLFYGKDGMTELASGENLSNLFRLFSKYIQCVLLNACHSQEQAVVVSQQIPYVIGTDNAISDSRAIAFSKGFYTALFNGESIDSAFEMAVAYVDFQNLPPSAQAVLYKGGQRLKGTESTAVLDQSGATRSVENPIENPIVTVPSTENTSNSWTDPRDGQSYQLTKVGDMIWMAENFRYELEGSLASEKNIEYGRFYTWEQAITACPKGWHLPTNEEWDELFNAFGGRAAAAPALKSSEGWHQNNNGDNRSGFNAYPAGEYQAERKAFWNQEYYAHFWSATDLSNKMYKGDTLAHHIRLSYREKQALVSSNYKDRFFCVRYVRD